MEKKEKSIEASRKLASKKKKTRKCLKEIDRVVSNPIYGGCSMIMRNGEKESLIDLKKAVLENNVPLFTMTLNRKHGRDLERTGKSISEFGAQMPLMIVTAKMADIAGIKYTHFDGSAAGEKEKEIGLVVIDGNGRAQYLLNCTEEQWPRTVLGKFPVVNRQGLLDIHDVIAEVNYHVKMWGAKDFIHKRTRDFGYHKMWEKIIDLCDKGYTLRSAGVFAGLLYRSLRKSELLTYSNDFYFRYYDAAKDIHTAMIDKFGEGSDRTLKSTGVPIQLVKIWNELVSTYTVDSSKTFLVTFIKKLPKVKVNSINAATTLELKTEELLPDGTKKFRIQIIPKEEAKASQFNAEYGKFFGKYSTLLVKK